MLANDPTRAVFAGKYVRLYRLGSGEYEVHRAYASGRVAISRFKGSEAQAVREARNLDFGGPVQGEMQFTPIKEIGGLLF